jgi:ABC-type Zn2+ transport system substrate-binding protein/surface adhesin
MLSDLPGSVSDELTNIKPNKVSSKQTWCVNSEPQSSPQMVNASAGQTGQEQSSSAVFVLKSTMKLNKLARRDV